MRLFLVPLLTSGFHDPELEPMLLLTLDAALAEQAIVVRLRIFVLVRCTGDIVQKIHSYFAPCLFELLTTNGASERSM